jgi:hypothetical protein
VPGDVPASEEGVRAAELIAALSLATDLGIGVPLEHGLHSTLFAMRLCERLGVDPRDGVPDLLRVPAVLRRLHRPCRHRSGNFGEDDALTTYATPARFGSRPEMAVGMLRALAPPRGAPLARVLQVGRGIPKLARGFKGVVTHA